VVIDGVSAAELGRYYQIVDMYQSKHYWPGLYKPESHLMQHSLVSLTRPFVSNIYETSIMRVLLNTDNKDDYHLLFNTTEQSLISGYYKWHFTYNARKHRITLLHCKCCCLNANWLGRMLLSQRTLTDLNNRFIKQEL